MTVRIPTTVNWLLERRSRLLGQINAVDQRVAEYKKDTKLLKKLQRDLQSLERVIKMHELAAECGPGVPIRFKRYKSCLPHGQMTNLVTEYLEISEGVPRTATEVAMYVTARGGLNIPDTDCLRFRELIRYRLKDLGELGRIRRKPPLPGSREARWYIPPSQKNDS
jgi:hypothetical protein